jgi:ATP-dependent Clp protease ATP-binding subunit ClpA
MQACGVNTGELKDAVKHYLDNELEALKVDGETDPTPTSGFQRVVQRAILHVQSSGRDEVTGANVLVALFSERESYAVYFLQQQDMSRSTPSPTSRTASARARRSRPSPLR